ncbi:MAG: hypothetical protein IT367_18805 [Candidatus Hydrogenedentes bacterium]|nr:hypothetical protein [Candidatus Hydrogenedentota bacterium]
MNESAPPHHSHRATIALGALFILLSVASSPRLLERTVSPDGILDARTISSLHSAQLVLLGIAAAFISLRKRYDAAQPLRYWARRYPNALAATIGLVGVAIMFAAFETAYWFSNVRYADPSVYRYSNGDIHQYDSYLGYKPIPNHETTIAFSYNGELINSTTYTFDQFGRRVTPRPADAPVPDHSMLVFGCSFAFGSCVEGDETVAARLAQGLPDRIVYNYAYGGYGTQHMLAILERNDLNVEFEAPPDIALYFFIPAHIRRAYGSMIVITRWGEFFPYYTLDAANRPARSGSFHTSDALRVSLFHLLAHEQFMKHYKIDLPFRIDDTQLEHTVALIDAARRRFREISGSDRFYVVLWPKHPRDEISSTVIIPRLERAGIRYLDYTDIPEASAPGALTPYDLHPSASLHEAVAKRAAQELKTSLSMHATAAK